MTETISNRRSPTRLTLHLCFPLTIILVQKDRSHHLLEFPARWRKLRRCFSHSRHQNKNWSFSFAATDVRFDGVVSAAFGHVLYKRLASLITAAWSILWLCILALSGSALLASQVPRCSMRSLSYLTWNIRRMHARVDWGRAFQPTKKSQNNSERANSFKERVQNEPKMAKLFFEPVLHLCPASPISFLPRSKPETCYNPNFNRHVSVLLLRSPTAVRGHFCTQLETNRHLCEC